MDFANAKVKDLKQECKRKGLKGYSNLRRDQLIDLLNGNDQNIRKRKITKKERLILWEHYFGASKRRGKCYCCNIDIDFFTDYEAGHVIPFSKDGSDNLENLRPICRTCNRSMGVENLEEFKQKIQISSDNRDDVVGDHFDHFDQKQNLNCYDPPEYERTEITEVTEDAPGSTGLTAASDNKKIPDLTRKYKKIYNPKGIFKWMCCDFTVIKTSKQKIKLSMFDSKMYIGIDDLAYILYRDFNIEINSSTIVDKLERLDYREKKIKELELLMIKKEIGFHGNYPLVEYYVDWQQVEDLYGSSIKI